MKNMITSLIQAYKEGGGTADRPPLLILTGPTAVGKSAASIGLAQNLNGEIISADSIQVYRGLNIGSAKITAEEMQNVPHHLIDVLDPSEPYNVMRFQQMVFDAMADIYRRGKLPILTGGTGFYIQAVLYDINFAEENENEIRERLEKEAAENGAQALHERLKHVDPEYASSVHANNVKRVIRALEFYEINGYPLSKHNEREHDKQSPFNFVYFVLTMDRECLYSRIEERVDLMISQGLLQEVSDLRTQGFDKTMTSMQGIGYKEILDYFDGLISLEEAIRIIKRDTRHFAKRQLTWFRREKTVTWVEKEQFSDERQLLAYLIQTAKETMQLSVE